VNILTGKIGDKLPITISVDVQNQAHLLPLSIATEPLAPQEEPQFQRHVEARQVRSGVQLYCGEIVYAELAFLHDSLDFREPWLARVVLRQRTTCDKAEIVDCKYDGIEDGLV